MPSEGADAAIGYARMKERAERAEADAREQKKFADTFQGYNEKHLRERNEARAERDKLRALLVDMRAADQGMRMWQWAPRINAAMGEKR